MFRGGWDRRRREKEISGWPPPASGSSGMTYIPASPTTTTVPSPAIPPQVGTVLLQTTTNPENYYLAAGDESGLAVLASRPKLSRPRQPAEHSPLLTSPDISSLPRRFLASIRPVGQSRYRPTATKPSLPARPTSPKKGSARVVEIGVLLVVFPLLW